MKLKKIAELYGITEAGVSLSVKSTINKMVEKLIQGAEYDMVEISLGIIGYLGIEPKSYYKKLNNKNKFLLKKQAEQAYYINDKEKEEFKEKLSCFFEE